MLGFEALTPEGKPKNDYKLHKLTLIMRILTAEAAEKTGSSITFGHLWRAPSQELFFLVP